MMLICQHRKPNYTDMQSVICLGCSINARFGDTGHDRWRSPTAATAMRAAAGVRSFRGLSYRCYLFKPVDCQKRYIQREQLLQQAMQCRLIHHRSGQGCLAIRLVVNL